MPIETAETAGVSWICLAVWGRTVRLFKDLQFDESPESGRVSRAAVGYWVRVLGVLVCAFAPSTRAQAAADAAHFWLSTSSVATAGPSNVSLSPTAGATDTLYIWGRPTDGQQLRNLSLNLITVSDGIDFMDGGFTVYNEVTLSIDRFEYLQDSSSSPALVSEYTSGEVASGSEDGLYGINAFTLFDSASLRGIGPTCTSGETGCVTAGDGGPAWLLAEIAIESVTAGKTVDLHLQVGDLGIVEWTIAEGDYDYQGEVDSADYSVWSSAFGSTTELAADGNGDGTVDAADYSVWRDNLGDTGMVLTVADAEVRFGADAMGGDEPTHNALTDYGINLAGDDPDATITISAPASAVPEPSAWMLAALVSGTACSGRSRQR